MFPREKEVEVLKFLEEHKAFSLCSVVDQKPACAPLYYVHDSSFYLYFLSELKTEHTQNITLNKWIAGTIYSEGHTIAEIHGLQFKGICKIMPDSNQQEMKKVYLNKFPEILDQDLMYKRFETTPLFEVKINWLRWITMDSGKPVRIEGKIN